MKNIFLIIIFMLGNEWIQWLIIIRILCAYGVPLVNVSVMVQQET